MTYIVEWKIEQRCYVLSEYIFNLNIGESYEKFQHALKEYINKQGKCLIVSKEHGFKWFLNLCQLLGLSSFCIIVLSIFYRTLHFNDTFMFWEIETIK